MQATLPQEVGREVRIQMLRNGSTQGRLAELLHMSQQAVSRRLLGHVCFSLEDLVRLAREFDIPLDGFLPVRGQAAGNSDHHPVSSAPTPRGEPKAESRLDGIAASTAGAA